MEITREKISQDEKLLERLNRFSVIRSFTPEVDINWDATTTDTEYESLYSSWSLLEGTGLDGALDVQERVKFVKYQQMNLMLIVGLLERYCITALSKLYDMDKSSCFHEYVGHFIKEELYHYTMFMRAVQKIQATMPKCPPLPIRRIDWILRSVFQILNHLPGGKLRTGVTFTYFSFGEQVTIFAHQMVQSKIARKQSLINQVWAYHALDESRHLAFDAMILKRNQLWWPLAWITRFVAVPFTALISTLVNANEVWAAQQLGVRVRLWQLPSLIRRTKAPFKRRVFGIWTKPVEPVAKEVADGSF
jgi:predicted metal-dependent hydrolase